jgi:hypothetical protein
MEEDALPGLPGRGGRTVLLLLVLLLLVLLVAAASSSYVLDREDGGADGDGVRIGGGVGPGGQLRADDSDDDEDARLRGLEGGGTDGGGGGVSPDELGARGGRSGRGGRGAWLRKGSCPLFVLLFAAAAYAPSSLEPTVGVE